MTNEYKWLILRSLPILNDKDWNTIVSLLDKMIQDTENRKWDAQYLF